MAVTNRMNLKKHRSNISGLFSAMVVVVS